MSISLAESTNFKSYFAYIDLDVEELMMEVTLPLKKRKMVAP